MNLKEMEVIVNGLVEKLGRLDLQHVQNLSDRIDRVVQGFTTEVNGLHGRIETQAVTTGELIGTLQTGQDWLRSAMHGVQTGLEEVQQKVVKVDLELETLNVLRATVDESAADIARIGDIVEARNKSAPTKRNMTDDDARRVLNGDSKDLAHKEAAAKLGLTYAQVYSCRGEFTFKHVLKELRDSGWVNPFKKPEPQHK